VKRYRTNGSLHNLFSRVTICLAVNKPHYIVITGSNRFAAKVCSLSKGRCSCGGNYRSVIDAALLPQIIYRMNYYEQLMQNVTVILRSLGSDRRPIIYMLWFFVKKMYLSYYRNVCHVCTVWKIVVCPAAVKPRRYKSKDRLSLTLPVLNPNAKPLSSLEI
jgi:hypothetical protein